MIGLLHGTQTAPGTGPAVDGDFRRNLGKAPHTMFDPLTRERWTYYLANQASKALSNKTGGVETNNRLGGVYQVEIVGMSEDFWAYPDSWYANLREFLLQLTVELDIPYLLHPDHTRLTFEQWQDPALAGWYAHAHVPENDHWDPGTLDYARLTLPENLTMPALSEESRVRLFPGGDRSQPPLSQDVLTTLGIIADAANQAEVTAKSVLAAVKAAAPAPLNLTTVSTRALLDELARRTGA